jgi:hypothetical protein
MAVPLDNVMSIASALHAAPEKAVAARHAGSLQFGQNARTMVRLKTSVEASGGGATKVALIRPKVMLEQITSLKEISAAAGIKGAVISPQGASRATFWRCGSVRRS